MSKKAGKAIIGLACAGAVLGAVFAYLGIKKKHSEALDDDFDDFSDEFEAEERSYTTIPKDPSDASEPADPGVSEHDGAEGAETTADPADEEESDLTEDAAEEFLDEEDETETAD